MRSNECVECGLYLAEFYVCEACQAKISECEHCPDGHEDPRRRPWAVMVSDRTDGDDQPVTLLVSKTGCQHVAESDAEWLRQVIREARNA